MLGSEFDVVLNYTDRIELDKITRKIYIEFRRSLRSYLLDFDYDRADAYEDLADTCYDPSLRLSFD
jgi:hypothetical protein